MKITCITLSSKAMQRDIFSNMVYYNHVREFSDVVSLHNERLESIRSVKTPYFFYCDYDDPIPYIDIELNKAIIYGDNIYKQFDVERIIKAKEWSINIHLSSPYLIHKAICNTELSNDLIDVLPRGEYWTELLLYFSLAKIGGYEYNNKLKIIWNKNPYGMHSNVRQAVMNSTLWLLNNERILNSMVKRGNR